MPALADQGRLTVFAAASLRGVLEEIGASHSDEITFSFAGSGAIARQIAAGAPADLVVLANPAWMDWLTLTTQEGPEYYKRRDVAGNRLVLIGAPGAAPLTSADELPQRLDGGRLAMGQRAAVPAGSYARQWLEAEGLWQTLEPQLAETDNVRAALALVARRAAPMGVVYATDAQAEAAVSVLYAIPAEHHDPIRYPAVALSRRGADFLDHLTSAPSLAIFAAHGFTRAVP